MRSSEWAPILAPLPPAQDTDAISRAFFKPSGKNGELKFKTGRCVIYLHIPNPIYDHMEDHRASVEMEREVCNLAAHSQTI